MKHFHESGCFIQKRENGVVVNQMPRGVKSFRVHFQDGRIKELYNKVYYLKDRNVLEVEMYDGTRRYFEYRMKRQGFVEIEEEHLLLN